METFPKDFLWGAATSAYQVEGDNVGADWWAWEKDTGKERSGRACRHYELYERDFDLAQSLNHNAHRFSTEWSRIEPEEGIFVEQELKHYVDVIRCLRSRHIEPLVTLHHFTNPLWFARSGGWLAKGCVERFLQYADRVVRALAKDVRYWITVNEPTIYFSHSYLFGAWPPQQRSFLRMKAVEQHLITAHIQAYGLIHKIYKELRLPEPCVGIAQYTQAYIPCRACFRDKMAAYLRDKLYNFGFLDAIARHSAMDFIGVNYYTRQVVEPKNWGLASLAMDVCKKNHRPAQKNSLDWDIYPEGLEDILLRLKKYDRPAIVTENGICTDDDALRWGYIRKHLKHIHRAMGQGADVRGYLYWSLLDNFEWDKGFGPRFGLVGVDYNTYERSVRDSAKKFAQVCKTGVLEDCEIK
ncbi:MAG: glycoside hydrolase family 1 protein [Candidatus Omnitrophica bacterium]|nr:glycoside hydrolase family 1 protein [Candidatus Omnitrophota bacterium]